MASVHLTRGAISSISAGGQDDKPVLQVLEVRLVNTVQSAAERYRMLISDGVHHQQAMLATQMNGIVKSGHLQKSSIVQLNEYICNVIQGRRIIIIISLEVLVENCDVIGEPKAYDAVAGVSQNRAPDPAQPSVVNHPALSSQNVQPPVGQISVRGPKKESPLNDRIYDGSYSGSAVPGSNASNTSTMQEKVDSGPGNFAESKKNGGVQLPNPSGSSIGGFRPPGNSCGRPAQSTYQQPPPIMYTNRGPIAKNEAPARIIPITALNPYQGRWTIKARVTAKAELRHYNNPRGEGKVFSFDLLDSDGGEIRAICFNMVADQFYDQIEVGKVYLISKGTLRPSQKTYNHLNNEYEIMLESTSTIQPCLEEDNNIPRQQFNFRAISEIESMDNNSMVDIIGIVTSVHPAITIMRKNGTETHKRTLQLKDMSGRSVEITLWGNFCNTEGQKIQGMCDSGIFPVLAVKASRVSDFNGKSVGTISSSHLLIDPDIPEAHQLKQWYDTEGKSYATVSISRETATVGRVDSRKTVSQIKDEGLGRSEKPDWITVKATVSFMKVDNFCYMACPLMIGDRQCNKKVTNYGDGTYHCDRCDQSFPECDYRYLLQFQIQDHTGLTWVTAFQECGQEILGVSAKELYLLKYDVQDESKFSEVIRSVLFNQYLFKLKVKEEIFSDEQRVKSTVVKAERVNPSSESRFLLALIEKFSGEDVNTILAAQGMYGSGIGMSSSGYTPMEYKHGNQSMTNMSFSGGGFDRFKIEPSSQMGHRVNQYGEVLNHSMGNREMQSFCDNCGSTGHSLMNCPRNINRQGQSVGAGFANRSSTVSMDGGNSSSVCFKCQQPGHWARECPRSNAISSGYGSNMSAAYGKQYV